MKKSLQILIVFAFFCLSANAQTWAWAKSGGSVSIEYSNATCTDANGNVYITGTFQGSSVIFGNDTLHNNAAGNLDVFIAKFDANGNVLWARSGGGTNNDYTYGICTDANDNVFIEGYSNGSSITFDTITLNSSVNEFIFIVKYDSIGNVQWGKNGRGTASYGWGICSDVAGNVYLYGNSDSYSNNIIFDNDTLGYGAFIVKYDGGGNVVWAKKIATGVTNNGRQQSMCSDSLGNIYVTGTYQNLAIFGNDTLLTSFFDVFIAKYNSSGNFLWVKSPSGQAVGNAISADVNGNIYLTGYFGNSVVFGNDTLAALPFSNFTIFMAKYDTNGNSLWGRSPGGTSSDMGLSICTDSSGNVFVTGYFTSPYLNFGGIPVINNNIGNSDIFIAKYDANGNAHFAQSIGAGSEYGMGVCADRNNNVYLTGYFGSYSINFGSNIVTNNGSYDIFLAKLANNIVTTIAEVEVVAGVSVYPNPFTTATTITLQGTSHNPSLFIYNLLGQEAGAYCIGTNKQITFHRNNLPAGMYFYKLIEDNKEVLGIGKMIIE